MRDRNEDQDMNEHGDRQIHEALKRSFPPIDIELRRDLWPTVLARLDARPAHVPSAARCRIEDVPVERQPGVLAVRQPRVVFEGDLEPRRCTGRHGLFENNGYVEGECPCGAAKCSACLSLYAADRADRLLRRGRTADKSAKKRHNSGDQPM